MEFLKGLFSIGPISYEEFESKVAERGFKVADLSQGKYVSKAKHQKVISERDVLQVKYTSLLTLYNDLLDTIYGDDGINTRIKMFSEELNSKIDKLEGLNKNKTLIYIILKQPYKKRRIKTK